MARLRFLGDLSSQISCPSFANAEDGHVFLFPFLVLQPSLPAQSRSTRTPHVIQKYVRINKRQSAFVFCLLCVITTYKTIARTIVTTEITDATHVTIVAIVALFFAF